MIYLSIPQQYFHNRVKSLQAHGVDSYPHKFQVSISIAEFITKYDHLQRDQTLKDETVSIAGAIVNPFRYINLSVYCYQ